MLTVRLGQDLDDTVLCAAERSGASRAEWVRCVLDEAVNRGG